MDMAMMLVIMGIIWVLIIVVIMDMVIVIVTIMGFLY